jgi:hypothetical protein
VVVLARGEPLIDPEAAPGAIPAARGRGRFLARERSDALRPAGRVIPEVAQLSQWGDSL